MFNDKKQLQKSAENTCAIAMLKLISKIL